MKELFYNTLRATTGLKCDPCEFEAENTNDLETHKQLEHMTVMINVGTTLENLELECDQCGYKCKLNIQFIKEKSM